MQYKLILKLIDDTQYISHMLFSSFESNLSFQVGQVFLLDSIGERCKIESITHTYLNTTITETILQSTLIIHLGFERKVETLKEFGFIS